MTTVKIVKNCDAVTSPRTARTAKTAVMTRVTMDFTVSNLFKRSLRTSCRFVAAGVRPAAADSRRDVLLQLKQFRPAGA